MNQHEDARLSKPGSIYIPARFSNSLGLMPKPKHICTNATIEMLTSALSTPP